MMRLCARRSAAANMMVELLLVTLLLLLPGAESCTVHVHHTQGCYNDSDWQVALHVVFTDRAAHDAYQDHPRHQAFLEASAPNWAQVRVFDTAVAG